MKFARKSDGKGTITLKFASDDELQQIMDLLGKIKN